MWSSVPVACAICFAHAEGPLLDAARLGVLVMVAVTATVLLLFARFFLRIAKKGDSPLFPVDEKGDSPLFDIAEKGDSPLFLQDGGRTG